MIFQSKRGSFVKMCKQVTNVYKIWDALNLLVINHNLMRKPNHIFLLHSLADILSAYKALAKHH